MYIDREREREREIESETGGLGYYHIILDYIVLYAYNKYPISP